MVMVEPSTERREVEPADPGRPVRGHRRRRWIVAIVVTSALVVTGFVGVRWWLTRPPAHVTVEQAVDRYRSSTSSSSPAAGMPTVPAAGVYVYRTTGSESVDAMGGDSHTYPSPTTITVRPTACGYDLSWIPVEGRSDVTSLCSVGGGWQEAGAVNVHEFFHISDGKTFVCDPGTWYVPPTATTSWTSACHAEDMTSTRTSHVVGTETVTVGDRDVAALHVHVDEVVSGASTGSTQLDLWLDPTTALLLQQLSTATTANDTVVGHVSFQETISLQLQSMTPQT